jgi:foldase protein PrsA
VPAERSPADLFGGGRGGEPHHEPIARVNDHPIARRRVVDLLLQSHGVGILEQLIVLDEAERLAAKKGLTVSQADVDREYELALRRLTDPLSSMTSGPFDREAAERTLEAVLADRNISREEFLIGMRRHAYLRRIVESEQVLTEEQLRAEFERSFGRRVQVRHIQLATPRQIDSVRQRLAAGDKFAELARAYSANTVSAPAGGLLEPFSPDDQDVPASFRQAAFALRPPEVSDAIRVGEWYHILQLEKVIPAEDVDFEQVRGEVERKLRYRLTEPAMQRLYERLFREANIDIHDPVLKKAFETTHRNHRR